MDGEIDLRTDDRDVLIGIIVRQQAIIERLEKHIAQSEGRGKSGGSGRMPGLKPKGERKPAQPKKPRQPRRHGFARARMTPDRRVEHALEQCPDCGVQLSGDWFLRWIEEYGAVQRWRQSTIDRYTGIVNEHLTPRLGNLHLDDLSARHVQRLQVALLRGGMEAKGVQLVRTVLSGAVNYAISLGRRSTSLVVDPPKTERGRRTVRLPAVAVEVLRQHPQRQQKHIARFSEVYENNNLVFAYEVGRFVNPMNLTRAVKALAARPISTTNGPKAAATSLSPTVSTLRRYRPATSCRRLSEPQQRG